MPAKKASGVSKTARKTYVVPGDSETEAAPQQPAKLNLYDSGALKGTLDDCAKEVILDAGYDEDVSVSNVKIALGLIAIAVALYSQFGPGKFPDTWWTILACVVVYVILTVTLHLFSWRHEGEAFLLTKPKAGQAQGPRLSSGLERYGEQYTLRVYDEASALERTGTWAVGGLFHEDGYLAESVYREKVAKLLEQWEAAQHSGQAKKSS